MQGFDNSNITLYGGMGTDTLNGTNGHDNLYGGSEDDRLLGYAGKDVLNGEEGNDYLEGGADNDTYIFNVGFGVDTINDSYGLNTIIFGQGLNEADIASYRTNWNDLTMTFNGVEDKIIIQGYFISENNRKYDLVFADGSKYEYTSLESPMNQVLISDNDDWVQTWTEYNIYLNGMGGNDNITGGAGNDILIGEKGNDVLNGGKGDDIYRFRVGDGKDIITDKEGLNKLIFEDAINLDVVIYTELNGEELSLIIVKNDLQDEVRINGFDADNFLFEFSDGTSYCVDISGKTIAWVNLAEIA